MVKQVKGERCREAESHKAFRVRLRLFSENFMGFALGDCKRKTAGTCTRRSV